MVAFEVSINGHRVGLAGVESGIADVSINCSGGSELDNYCHLNNGGMDRSTEEFLRWNAPSISVGADILVRVIEAETVDPPQ